MAILSGQIAVKWSLIGAILNQLIGVCCLFFLAKHIKVVDFGYVSITSFVILLASTLGKLGFEFTVVQKKYLKEEQLSSIFWLLIGVNTSISVGLYLSAPIIANLISQPPIANIIRWLCIIPLLQGLIVVPDGLLRKNLNFKLLSIKDFLASSIAAIGAIYLAINNYGYSALIAQQLIIASITLVMVFAFARWKPRCTFQANRLVTLWPFSRNMLFTQFLAFYNKESPRLFIGIFLGPTSLGYYAIANRCYAQVIGLVTVALTKVTFPYFSSIQDDRNKLQSSFLKVTSLVSLIAFPLLFGLIFFAEPLFITVFGDKWLDVIPIFQILMLIGLVTNLSFFNGTVLTALGRADIRMKLGLLRTFIGTVFLYIGAQYSLLMVAILFLARIVLIEPFQLFLTIKLIDLNWRHYMKNVMPAFISSLIIGLCFSPVRNYYFLMEKLDLFFLVCAAGSSMLILYLTLSMKFNRPPVDSLLSLLKQRGSPWKR